MATEVILKPSSQTDSVSAPDPLDIRTRIDELKRLEKGWLDGAGIAPSQLGLSWLADSFDAYYPDDAPRPYLFPTPEGRVLAEWPLTPWALSLEFDLAGKTGEWHVMNVDTEAEETRDLDLANADDWNWLAQRIHGFGAENA